MRKEYIGDGVYAEFDGSGINLTTQRERGEEHIYLEPEVLFQLIRFNERMTRGENTTTTPQP